MVSDAVVCYITILNLCYTLQNLCHLFSYLSVAKISHSVHCENQKCLTSYLGMQKKQNVTFASKPDFLSKSLQILISDFA